MDRSALLQSAGLIGGALVGLAVSWYRPRGALSARACEVRRGLRAATPDLDGYEGEAVVIEGTLIALKDEGRAPLVVTAVPREAEPSGETASRALTVGAALGVRLDATADGRPGAVVALEGPVQVLVGSADTGRPVPAEKARAWLRGLEHAALPGAEVTLRALSSGDRVLAAGVLRKVAPSDSAEGYRGRAGAHALVAPGEGGAGAVALVFTGAPRPLGRFAGSHAAHALAGAAVIAALIAGVRTMPVALVPPMLMETACPADLDARIDAAELSSAAESAEACGDDLRAARARWLLADFDRASRALLRARRADRGLAASATEISAHLLAGRDAEAATAARDLAARGVLRDEAKGKLLLCLADALDLRAGDAGGQGRLRARASQHPLCALLLADTLDGKERLAVLPEARGPHYSWPPVDIATTFLRHEVDSRAPLAELDFYASGALTGARDLVLPQALALVDEARGSLGNDKPWHRADLDLVIATFHSYLGEHADAADEVRRALARGGLVDPRAPSSARQRAGDVFHYWPPAGDPERLRDQQLDFRRPFFLGAVLATRAHEIDNARAYLALAPEESNGAAVLRPVLEAMGHDRYWRSDPDVDPLRELRARERWPPHVALWDAVLTAGGGPEKLAQALRETHGDGRAVIPFLPSWVTDDSPALRSWVTSAYPPACWTCGVSALVDHLAGRREVAEVLGERALAARLRAPLLRLRDAMLRRDLAMPLLALDQLTRK